MSNEVVSDKVSGKMKMIRKSPVFGATQYDHGARVRVLLSLGLWFYGEGNRVRLRLGRVICVDWSHGSVQP